MEEEQRASSIDQQNPGVILGYNGERTFPLAASKRPFPPPRCCPSQEFKIDGLLWMPISPNPLQLETTP